MGRAQKDETLWDADKEGKITLRHSLACAPPPGHRGYKGIGRVEEGKKGQEIGSWARATLKSDWVAQKNKRDGEDAARGAALGC